MINQSLQFQYSYSHWRSLEGESKNHRVVELSLLWSSLLRTVVWVIGRLDILILGSWVPLTIIVEIECLRLSLVIESGQEPVLVSLLFQPVPLLLFVSSNSNLLLCCLLAVESLIRVFSRLPICCKDLGHFIQLRLALQLWGKFVREEVLTGWLSYREVSRISYFASCLLHSIFMALNRFRLALWSFLWSNLIGLLWFENEFVFPNLNVIAFSFRILIQGLIPLSPFIKKLGYLCI